MSNPVAVLTVAAALIGPAVTFLVAARRMSGRIATSDASDLWAEARDMRQDYRDRLAASEARAARVEERMAKLEDRHNECVKENKALRNEVAELKAKLEAK